MLRFNFKDYDRDDFEGRISIHPMLRFNAFRGCRRILGMEFQYILCYGSTFQIFHKKIPPKIFQYILCYGSTRTVPLCHILKQLFQYILCYGSTLAMSNQNMQMRDFNTSYVTVQRYNFCIRK